jgi:hypothetical protein
MSFGFATFDDEHDDDCASLSTVAAPHYPAPL